MQEKNEKNFFFFIFLAIIDTFVISSLSINHKISPLRRASVEMTDIMLTQNYWFCCIKLKKLFQQ